MSTLPQTGTIRLLISERDADTLTIDISTNDAGLAREFETGVYAVTKADNTITQFRPPYMWQTNEIGHEFGWCLGAQPEIGEGSSVWFAGELHPYDRTEAQDGKNYFVFRNTVSRTAIQELWYAAESGCLVKKTVDFGNGAEYVLSYSTDQGGGGGGSSRSSSGGGINMTELFIKMAFGVGGAVTGMVVARKKYGATGPPPTAYCSSCGAPRGPTPTCGSCGAAYGGV